MIIQIRKNDTDDENEISYVNKLCEATQLKRKSIETFF